MVAPAPPPAVTRAMSEWVTFKELVVDWVGLDKDALHVLAGLATLLAAAMVLRRPIASPWPWLTVLALELGNEIVSGLADGTIEEWERAGSIHDLWVVMLAPTVLSGLARWAPRLYWRPSPRAPARPLLLLDAPARANETIDAEFEEVDPEDERPARSRPAEPI